MCAKALYNFSGEDAPFDPDAQFWVIPAALTLSRRLGIDDSEVVDIVVG
jgi:hypothetical protein